MLLELQANSTLLKHIKLVQIQKPEVCLQQVIEMTPMEVLDTIYDLWQRHQDNYIHNFKPEYNWWVDVYNFKRGKIILKEKL